jgi:hypothetical protein
MYDERSRKLVSPEARPLKNGLNAARASMLVDHRWRFKDDRTQLRMRRPVRLFQLLNLNATDHVWRESSQHADPFRWLGLARAYW